VKAVVPPPPPLCLECGSWLEAKKSVKYQFELKTVVYQHDHLLLTVQNGACNAAAYDGTTVFGVQGSNVEVTVSKIREDSKAAAEKSAIGVSGTITLLKADDGAKEKPRGS
jgi:hypothetical protein